MRKQYVQSYLPTVFFPEKGAIFFVRSFFCDYLLTVKHMKYMNVPFFENITPICSFLLGFKVGRYVCNTYTVRPRKKETHKSSKFSENCNDLSEKVYIVTKFSLSSFFWHQL